jgi:hypothetical protein
LKKPPPEEGCAGAGDAGAGAGAGWEGAGAGVAGAELVGAELDGAGAEAAGAAGTVRRTTRRGAVAGAALRTGVRAPADAAGSGVRVTRSPGSPATRLSAGAATDGTIGAISRTARADGGAEGAEGVSCSAVAAANDTPNSAAQASGMASARGGALMTGIASGASRRVAGRSRCASGPPPGGS